MLAGPLKKSLKRRHLKLSVTECSRCTQSIIKSSRSLFLTIALVLTHQSLNQRLFSLDLLIHEDVIGLNQHGVTSSALLSR